jgi:hypothetical protein
MGCNDVARHRSQIANVVLNLSAVGGSQQNSMSIPLIFSCLFMVAAYVIHVIDESCSVAVLLKRFGSTGGRNILGESSFDLTQATLSL